MIGGCITVHVYFPVKELRKTADEIVDEVRPDIASAEKTAPESDAEDLPDESHEDGADRPAPGREVDGSRAQVTVSPTASTVFSVSLVMSARAEEKDSEEETDEVIDASSPKIKKIKASLKKRYRMLLPLYIAGRIGERLDGYLAMREIKDLSLKERRKVSTLVKAENGDRKSLYTTIARENGIDDSKIKDIGRLFGKSWQKKSKTGWWIEVKTGKWVKKPKQPEKSKKPEKPTSA